MVATKRHSDTRSTRQGGSSTSRKIMVGAAIAVAVVVGFGARIYFSRQLPINSDEAVVGLMALHIRHLDFPALYWGQFYGGVEPYVAGILGVFLGYGTVLIKVTPILISFAVSVVVFMALRVSASISVAAVAAAVTWLWPANSIWNSLRETGFRGTEALFGVAVLALASAIRKWPGSAYLWGAIGLAAGLGLWASPEVIYFALPAGITVLPTLRRLKPKEVLIRLGSAMALFCAGAAPWLAVTVTSKFKTISDQGVSGGPGDNYISRLAVFLHHILPISIGTQLSLGGAWEPAMLLAISITVAVGIMIVILALRALANGSDLAPFSAALLGYPFIYALFPTSNYWYDGRYATYLPFIIAVVIADSVTRMPTKPTMLISGVVAVTLALTLSILGTAQLFRIWDPPALQTANPNLAQSQLVSSLERGGIRYVYAQYWVAYVIDFLSQGKVVASQLGGAQRYPLFDQEVQQAQVAAYLFASSSTPPLGQILTWGTPTFDPLPVTRAKLIAYLQTNHIAYRDWTANGFLIVVPAKNVIPELFM